jgi:hypothetical protein
MNVALKLNIDALNKEIEWFEKVLDCRFKLYFRQDCVYNSVLELELPVHDSCSYADFLKEFKCTAQERLLIMLAIVPHIRPQALDVFYVKNETYDKWFTEFGGLKGTSHNGFLPTGETALFLIAGDSLHDRMEASTLLSDAHYLAKNQILRLNKPPGDEPVMSGLLTISEDYLEYFVTGQNRKLRFSRDFPAKLITTEITWQELVLPEDILAQVAETKAWIDHSKRLLIDWELQRKIKPGFRSLFYGPPGTGKTLVACLLGKSCNMDVYRIDLSMLVSKYIGETEKNLERVFDLAENKNWILFFDEADALFSKRTGVSNSHDRYANQETAYLLQRIEDFKGIAVLATNLKTNIDDAFSRRFQSIIYFPIPQPEERLRLWKQSFSSHTVLEDSIDLVQLARKHEMTGGMILNVIRYSSLMALSRNENIIRLSDAERGIQREFLKEGRIM